MQDRTLSAAQFREVLETLAHVSAVAFSLKHDLEPLTPEDIQAGAEPLSQGQIQGSLNRIQHELASLALETLKATPEEWYAANDTVQ